MSELYPLPKLATLLIVLTERRNADSETYLDIPLPHRFISCELSSPSPVTQWKIGTL